MVEHIEYICLAIISYLIIFYFLIAQVESSKRDDYAPNY